MQEPSPSFPLQAPSINDSLCSAADISIFADNYSYFMQCYLKALSHSRGKAFCSPIGPGSRCFCVKCQSLLDSLLMSYGKLKNANCSSIPSSVTFAVARVSLILQKFTCCILRANCSNPINDPLCATPANFLQSGLQTPGVATRARCLNAIENSCTYFPNQPFCGRVNTEKGAEEERKWTAVSHLVSPTLTIQCLNGVCYAQAVNVSFTNGPISLYSVSFRLAGFFAAPPHRHSLRLISFSPFAHLTISHGMHSRQLMCDESGPLAAQYVLSASNASYSVSLGTVSAVNNSAQFDNSTLFELYPANSDWSTNPVIFTTSNCSALNYSIDLIGSMYVCLPGFLCTFTDNHISGITFCPGGYYCPTTFSTPLRCPAGYFCPIGSSSPFPCEFLESCPEGSNRKTSYAAAAYSSILIGLFCFVYVMYRIKERFRLTRVGADEQALKRDNTALPTVYPLSISFSDIGVTVAQPSGGHKVIMQGVSGEFAAGEMTAIMGGSGAGKTTLLSALTGKISRSSGDILINGRPGELHRYKTSTSFVPQDDTMLTMMSVEENLTFRFVLCAIAFSVLSFLF